MERPSRPMGGLMRRVVLVVLSTVFLFSGPSWAAISYVTSATGGVWDNTGDSDVATASWSLSAGDFVAVCVRWAASTATISTVTDTASNTYADSGAGRVQVDGVTDSWTQLFYAYNTSANASNVVTVTFSGTAGYQAVIASEYSGVQTSADPKDVGNTGTANNQASVTSGSFTPSVANEVAIACVSKNGSTSTITAGTNYTVRTQQFSAIPNYVNGIEDRIGAPVSSQTASASVGAGTDFWSIIVYTFKEATSGRRAIAPVMLK